MPSRGKLIDVQAREQGRWRTFATVRTPGVGRVRTRYRFRRAAPRKTYPMRVRVRPDAAYPFAVGYSRIGEGPRAVSALRDLPPVDALAAQVDAPRALAVAAARAVLAERRRELLAGATTTADLGERARELAAARAPALRRVLNATGVIVHTNLGRAPLAAAARERGRARPRRATRTSSSTSTPARAARATTHVEALLRELTGAEAALAVNNGAAAALLAAAALAGPGASIVVSRGQLVEIGGGFRDPRRRRAGRRAARGGRHDEPHAAAPTTSARSAPATRRDPARAPVELPHRRLRRGGRRSRSCATLGVPVIDDVGSGVLADGLRAGRRAAGAALGRGRRRARLLLAATSCSAARRRGCSSARAEAVAACRRHPLARALRIDKLPLAALEATLALLPRPRARRREIPVLAMLTADAGDLRTRARARSPRATRRRGRRGGRAGRRRRAAAARAARPGGRRRPAPAPTRWPPRCAPATRRSSPGSRDGRVAARPAHADRRRGWTASEVIGAARRARLMPDAPVTSFSLTHRGAAPPWCRTTRSIIASPSNAVAIAVPAPSGVCSSTR